MPDFLFDPDDVPWPTTFSDWSLCLIPPDGHHIWVESDLVMAILGPGAERYSAEYHDVFTKLAGAIGRLLSAHPEIVPDERCVRAIGFSRLTVRIRLGTFGGRRFVFRPRKEFEGEWSPEMVPSTIEADHA